MKNTKKVKPYSLFDELVAIGAIYIILICTPLFVFEYKSQKEEINYSQDIIKMVKKVTIDVYIESERKDLEINTLKAEVQSLKNELKTFNDIREIKKDLDRNPIIGR